MTYNGQTDAQNWKISGGLNGGFFKNTLGILEPMGLGLAMAVGNVVTE